MKYLDSSSSDQAGEIFMESLQQLISIVTTSFPGSFFGEGKTLVGAGHVAPRFWVLN